MLLKKVWKALNRSTWQDRQQLRLAVFSIFSSIILSGRLFVFFSGVFDPTCLCEVFFPAIFLYLFFYPTIFAFLLLLIHYFFPFIRSYCTYVPFWQWKGAGPRKRWPICWMMQWTHTSPHCRVCLWEWSTLKSWTLTSCWRLSKSILHFVLLRYDKDTHRYWSLTKKSLRIFALDCTILVVASSPGPASCSSAPALFHIVGYSGQDCARSPSRSLLASQSQISVWWALHFKYVLVSFLQMLFETALPLCSFRWHWRCSEQSSTLSGPVSFSCWCSSANGTDPSAAGELHIVFPVSWTLPQP